MEEVNMSQKRKLYERIRSNPNNVRFEDLDKLLQWCGFMPRSQRSGTSHHFYYKPNCDPLSIPYHRPVKIVYVKRALMLIERCGGLDDQEKENGKDN